MGDYADSKLSGKMTIDWDGVMCEWGKIEDLNLNWREHRVCFWMKDEVSDDSDDAITTTKLKLMDNKWTYNILKIEIKR